jgi:UDP-N-acetylglucosamine 2-epimerase (non-hydrolysing)
MKILTLFGTRPEIIRLSMIIKKIDENAEQILVHTGQNYDPNLSQIFLNELNIRKLDRHLSIVANSFGEQAGQILSKMDSVLHDVKPDRLLVLGDTNSGLASIVAARQGIPIYHLEAGNRCYDNRVPEEVNRRIIDHSSDVLLPYTHRSAANLVAEGIRRERIFVVGNPIGEVLSHFNSQIDSSTVMSRLGLKEGEYILATLHRAENVDLPVRLGNIILGLTQLANNYSIPVILSVHPRTADRIHKSGLSVDQSKLRLEKPFGLFDFIHLEKKAFAVVTDSGTVQEEACLFNIPNVTIRDVTERPETSECGSNILVGGDPTMLEAGIKLALKSIDGWRVPEEYLRCNVSETVTKILLSYRQ